MKLISCEKLEKSMVELQFSIDAETFKSAVNAAFKREGKKHAIPGFRKGKAPKAMIEKMYGKDLFQYDAINDLFPENYEAAVKEANIDVVGRPDAEVVSMSEDEGATLKVKVAVKPEVELGEYAGLTVNKDVKTVDEADVDAEIKRMQDRNGRLLTREGAAENGDTVDIDFEGFVDGVAFDGGKAEHYSLVLGSGSFIPGFEEQVVGHKAGCSNAKEPHRVSRRDFCSYLLDDGRILNLRRAAYGLKRAGLDTADDAVHAGVGARVQKIHAWRGDLRALLAELEEQVFFHVLQSGKAQRLAEAHPHDLADSALLRKNGNGVVKNRTEILKKIPSHLLFCGAQLVVNAPCFDFYVRHVNPPTPL